MTHSDILRLRYGTAEGSVMDENFTYCSDCNTVLKLTPLTPFLSGGGCVVCEFHRQDRVRHAIDDAAKDAELEEATQEDVLEALKERMSEYKKAEVAFTAFLREVRQFFSEEEFVEMCRGYYNEDDM